MPRRPFSSWYLILILSLILILGLWLLVSQGNLYQSGYYGKLYGNHLLWLVSGSEVRQEFVANYPGLNQVDVFVKNLKPADVVGLTLQLRETCQAQSDLRRQVALQPQGEIDGQTFYAFTFDPLEESTDRKYCFILSANTESDEKVIGALAGEGNVYPSGQVFYEEPLFGKTSDKPSTPPLNPEDGKFRLFLPILQANLSDDEYLDVAFQLHYQASPIQINRVFFDRLVKYKPYGWGRPEFYTLLLVAYIFGVTALIGFTIKQVK